MRCIMTPYSSSNSIRRFPWIWSFEKKLNIFRFSDFRISLDCNIPSLDQRLSPVCRAAWSQPLQPSRTVPHPLFENTAKLRIRLFMKTFPWEGPQRNVFMKRRICNLALFSERECGAVREGCSGCGPSGLQTGEASAGPNWECCNRAISEIRKTEKC